MNKKCLWSTWPAIPSKLHNPSPWKGDSVFWLGQRGTLNALQTSVINHCYFIFRCIKVAIAASNTHSKVTYKTIRDRQSTQWWYNQQVLVCSKEKCTSTYWTQNSEEKLKAMKLTSWHYVGHGAWHEEGASSYEGHLTHPRPTLGLQLAVFCDPVPCHSHPHQTLQWRHQDGRVQGLLLGTA
jgi:hypothetical protein